MSWSWPDAGDVDRGQLLQEMQQFNAEAIQRSFIGRLQRRETEQQQ